MRKEFFISYARKDQHWAEWIAWQLEDAGYTVVLSTWDFRPGSNFVIQINELLGGADRTIVVLSPAYLDSEFTQQEWQSLLAHDPRRERLIPVRVEECDLRGLFARLIYVDLVGLSRDEARDVLLGAVTPSRAKPARAPSFPGAVIPFKARVRPNTKEIIADKRDHNAFDVFMCHSSHDKVAVKGIALRLKEKGILPWLDSWEIQPGTDWQGALEHQMTNIKSASVLVGSPEFGPWQDLEKKAFLQQFLTRACPVIPVILSGYEGDLKLPPFLSMFIM